MARKNNWELVPDGSGDLATPPPESPVPGKTYEQQEVYRKYIGNTAEAIAKVNETDLAGRMVDALNDNTTQAGVTGIETYVALANQPRDPVAQPMVETYLKRRLNTRLHNRDSITNTGVGEVHAVVDRPLTPDPKADPPKKKGLFGR